MRTAIIVNSKNTMKIIRSAGVGLVASLLDLLLLIALVEAAGLLPTQANIPALAAGLVVQFLGNKYCAFGDHSRHLVRQGALFALVELGVFALNGACYHAAVSWLGLPYVVARISCQSLIYIGVSYPLWNLIFHTSPQPVVKRTHRSRMGDDAASSALRKTFSPSTEPQPVRG